MYLFLFILGDEQSYESSDLTKKIQFNLKEIPLGQSNRNPTLRVFAKKEEYHLAA